MSTLWSPLRLPGFRRLFAGQALSDFANWSDFLALSTVVVYVWGHGALELALLSVCIGLPYVAVGPFVSLKIGRLDARAVLVFCDVLRFAAVISMLWTESLPALFALVFIKMCASSVFDPVRQASIKRLVPEDRIAEASSLSQVLVNGTKIIAPMVGGVCIALWGAFSPFWLGAGLYLLSAVILAGLPRLIGEAAERAKTRFKDDMKDALKYVRGRPALLYAIMYLSVWMFFVFLYDALFVLFTERLGLGEASLGVLMSGVGIGSVLGSLAAGRWTFWKAYPLKLMSRLGIVSGAFIAVVGIGAFGWLPASLWLWCAVFVVLGFLGGFDAVPYGYVLQTETTDATIAPVSALANALQTGSMLVAPLLGAALASWIGVGGVFLAVGLGMILFAATILGKLSDREARAACLETQT
ncbi:MFS transporter [Paenibacillus sp.]|uniref:MFS transporter n=1 Tax=Paenibacillus sp. TaxID=58172 RepID=UPI00281167F9|nr:MFS transporter [Paenibacillus sp.]